VLEKPRRPLNIHPKLDALSRIQILSCETNETLQLKHIMYISSSHCPNSHDTPSEQGYLYQTIWPSNANAVKCNRPESSNMNLEKIHVFQFRLADLSCRVQLIAFKINSNTLIIRHLSGATICCDHFLDRCARSHRDLVVLQIPSFHNKLGFWHRFFLRLSGGCLIITASLLSLLLGSFPLFIDFPRLLRPSFHVNSSLIINTVSIT